MALIICLVCLLICRPRSFCKVLCKISVKTLPATITPVSDVPAHTPFEAKLRNLILITNFHKLDKVLYNFALIAPSRFNLETFAFFPE